MPARRVDPHRHPRVRRRDGWLPAVRFGPVDTTVPAERLAVAGTIHPDRRVGGAGRIRLQEGILGAAEAGQRIDHTGGSKVGR